MKVQFIWPNFDCPIGLNIGLAYLSGALKVAGHNTKILHICEWLDYPFDLDRIEWIGSVDRRAKAAARARIASSHLPLAACLAGACFLTFVCEHTCARDRKCQRLPHPRIRGNLYQRVRLPRIFHGLKRRARARRELHALRQHDHEVLVSV